MSEDSTNDWETTKPEQTPEDGPEISAPSRWHRTSRLPDGTPVGRLGAYWYILDEAGSLISDGYHEISCDANEGYTGRRNARTGPVVLYPTPE
jgi:hypothetical protein